MNDPVRTALNAIENASRFAVTPGDLRRLMQTGEGEPSHLRALFGDVDLHTLLRLAACYGIEDAAFALAYLRARDEAAAANAELDEYAATLGLSPDSA